MSDKLFLTGAGAAAMAGVELERRKHETEITRLRAELAAALASEQMACVQRQNERRRADKAGDEVKRIIISAANKAASDISGMDESLDYDTALKLLGQLIEKGLNEGKAETELSAAQAALREAEKDAERYRWLKKRCVCQGEQSVSIAGFFMALDLDVAIDAARNGE